MKYADKIRQHLITCPGIFTIISLRASLGGNHGTASHALQELIDSGEVAQRPKRPGSRANQYQATELLRAPEVKAAARLSMFYTRRATVVGARVVRFVETPQDADPEHGVYYHRPQPAQAAMQAKSGPGMIW